VHIQESLPLAPLTTIRLGGSARFFGACASEQDIREAVEFARRRAIPLHILGGGSNVIFADGGFPGLVAQITIAGRSFQTLGDEGGGVSVEAGAGESWDTLVAESVARGLSGIECLSGIPGTVGGAPIQNIGAYGQEIAETLLQVDCLDRERLERVTFGRDACDFAYRTSRFKGADRDRFIVLAVRLRLVPNTRPALHYAELAAAVARRGGIDHLQPPAATALVRDVVLELRRGKSMVLDPADPDTRSVGSFFLNPVLSGEAFATIAGRWHPPSFPVANGVKVPAAWFVEQAGFRKGYTRDGVGLSRRHALALVNRGGTTAALLTLAEEIEHAVYAKFGVRLEREAVVVPPTA
jgi:UDP-N-acetylmuramate dehydrogenase